MNKSSIFILFLILFLFAIWSGVNWFQLGDKPNQYQNYFDQKVIIDGYIVSDPEIYHVHSQRFEIIPTVQYSQKIQVTVFGRSKFNYGDKIYLIGKIKQPKNFDDFDYIRNLQTKNIYAQISDPDVFVVGKSKLNPIIYYALVVKHFVFEKFEALLPREQAALLIAIVVGQKDQMPDADIQAFRATGTSHLIALSGYVLTLMMIILSGLAKYIGRNKTYLICIITATIYLVMSNFSTGIVRAAIMSGMFTIAKINGRQYRMLPALLFTAVILVVQNPLIIKYDIGFMLSFSSIFGIIYFVPILQKVFNKVPNYFLFKDILCTTISAQLVTVPITIYYFKELSLIALPANLLVLPLLEPILALSYFLCLPVLKIVFAKILLAILNYLFLIVYGLAQFKYSVIYAKITAVQLVGIYIAEIVLYLIKCRSEQKIARRPNINNQI
ncbi:MAG: comeC [Candidatus Doudnabacteria bacterium]|nr:comeC [Candidatus Doudnabacteria bacterium]